MITSVKNPRIKEVRLLQARPKARRDAGVFVVEGIRLAEEAVAAGWRSHLCLYTPDLNERGSALLEELRAAGTQVELVAEHVMKAASDTQSPQGLLLVVEQQTLQLPQHLQRLLVLDHLQDPGNAGTLLRTAAAAGFDAVLLTEGSVDPFSPKVLRAGMGAHFRLPVITLTSDDVVELCRLHQITLWTASAQTGESCYETDLRSALAIVIGSEAHGVGAPLQAASRKLHIPMPGGGESLNAAVAGAVLMFETVRQQTRPSP